MVRTAAAIAALLIGSTAAFAAAANVLVIGSTRAKSCMDAAFAGSDRTDAVAVCTAALQEDALTRRDRAGTHVNRGVLLMNRREHAQALADFDAAARLSPHLGEAFLNRGTARIAMGDNAQGLADINRGIALGLRQPEKAYFNRAIAREELEDAKGAYLDYRQAARLKPGWDLPVKEMARFTVTRAQ